MEKAERFLKEIREETTRGAQIIQKRIAGLETTIFCTNCKRIVRNGAWFARHVVKDENALDHIITSCSERCYIVNSKMLQRPAQVHQAGGLVRS